MVCIDSGKGFERERVFAMNRETGLFHFLLGGDYHFVGCGTMYDLTWHFGNCWYVMSLWTGVRGCDWLQRNEKIGTVLLHYSVFNLEDINYS